MENANILRPVKEENWLTNGETYAQLVYLGKGDSPDNWREVTQAEYEVATGESQGVESEEQ